MELGAMSCDIYPLDMSHLDEIPTFVNKAAGLMG